MPSILSITAPIYLIMGAGWLSVRFGLFDKRDTRVLGLFVADFCVPALLFKALSGRALREVLDARYLGAYALGSLAVMGSALFVQHRLRRRPMPQAAMQALGMSSSNSGFIGYPIASQLLGAEAGVALALGMIVENVAMIPLAMALADRAQSGTRSFSSFATSLRGMARNPMIVAIALGLLVAAAGLQLPEVLTRSVGLVAAAASPVALFVIGGALVGLRLQGMRREIALVAAGKLLLHPLAVLGGLLLLQPAVPTLRSAGIVYASVPMLSIYPVLAQKYGHEGLCAAALLVTTVLSFVTISGWIWVLHAGLGWAG